MTNTAAPPFFAPRKWEGAIAGLCGFVVFLIFVYFGDPGRATIAAAFFTAIAISMRICWPLRRHYWFWIAITALIVIHLIAIVVFSWSAASHWTGLTFIPFSVADIVVILTIIYILYRSIYGVPTRLVEKDDVLPDYHD